MSVTEALLSRLIDYAGLFPPASLEMQTAVENYHRYLSGDDGPRLGSFVLPVHRLAEFAPAFERVCCTEREAPWTLSLVSAGEYADDRRLIEDFQQGAAFIGSLEIEAADAASAQAALRALPRNSDIYVEVPPQRMAEVLPVLFAEGARAKLRTVGPASETIPSVAAVSTFLLACARERLPWKAAGALRHAVRGLRPVTSDPGSPAAALHGFVNLFLAAALAWFGADEDAVSRTLDEQDPAAFQVFEDVIRWHGHTLITDQVEQVRRDFAISFSSASFTGPLENIRSLSWL